MGDLLAPDRCVIRTWMGRYLAWHPSGVWVWTWHADDAHRFETPAAALTIREALKLYAVTIERPPA